MSETSSDAEQATKVVVSKSEVAVIGNNTTVYGGIHQTLVYPEGYKPGPDSASMRRAYLYRQFCNAGVLSLEGIDPKAASYEVNACEIG